MDLRMAATAQAGGNGKAEAGEVAIDDDVPSHPSLKLLSAS
jgi:hypothetical protein